MRTRKRGCRANVVLVSDDFWEDPFDIGLVDGASRTPKRKRKRKCIVKRRKSK